MSRARGGAATGASAALALTRHGSRPARLAGSAVALAAGLGPHGSRAASRARAVAPDAAARAGLYRSYWADAAEATGAGIEDLGDGLLQVSRGRARTRVWNNLVPLDDPVSLQLAGTRARTHAALTRAGLRVPQHVLCGPGDLAPARPLLASAGSCVVKPAASTGAGQAVTCGVRSDADLRLAVAYAARWGDGSVLVEEQAVGVEHRLLVLDDRVLGATRRLPPVVIGDGTSSLGELVIAENDRRRASSGREGLFPLTLDLDAAVTQRRAGRRVSDVVAAGEVVVVKTAVNEAGPGQNHGLSDAPAGLDELVRRAAAALGLRLAAVEVVVPDDDGAPVVLEVNSTPGLHYHYQVAEGTHVARVCRPLLELLLSRSQEVR